MPNKDERLITLPLNDFINIALGSGDCGGFTYLPPNVAEIVHYHLKNKTLCYVEEPSDKEEMWKLWWLDEWVRSSERDTKAKIHSEKERLARRIMEHNVSIVAKYYKEFTSTDDDKAANARAYSLLSAGKMKSLVGLGVDVSKLITIESEL